MKFIVTLLQFLFLFHLVIISMSNFSVLKLLYLRFLELRVSDRSTTHSGCVNSATAPSVVSLCSSEMILNAR